MINDKFHVIFLCLIITCLSSCFSNTKYIGQYNLISSLDDGKKIAYLDYTELNDLELKEKYEGQFDYYPAEYADFDLMTCSMENPESIDQACIRRCKEVFGADLIIVSSRVSCREGLMRNKDYPSDDGVTYSANNTQDIGIIHFSVYDSNLGEELISFNTRTKTSGLGIKNDDGSTTTVNVSTCGYALGKARRKGIKKILKQFE